MPPPSTTFADTRVLLEHLDWVRRLARSLVTDPSLADDVAQETWFLAVRHGLARKSAPRAWLSGVVRNLARELGRGEGRRKGREARVARAEVAPSSHDLAERAAMQRDVVDGVLALSEPYRTTILQRYFEDLSPKEIARRNAEPVATVKTRLRRAHEQLRQRLEHEHGRAFLLALVPASARDAGVAASGAAVAGALIVSTKTVVAAVSIAVLAVAGALFLLREEPASPLAPTPAEASAAHSAELVPALDEPPPLAEREEVAEVERAVPIKKEEEKAVAAEAGRVVSGRVVDVDSRPRAGVEVGFVSGGREPEAWVESDQEGRFELETHRESGTIVARHESLVTVMEARVFASQALYEAVVVVAPRAALAGEVVDSAGTPLAGVDVSLMNSHHFRQKFEHILDQSLLREWQTVTDAQGLFELPDAPAIDYAFLSAMLKGYAQETVDLTGAPQLQMHIVLKDLEETGEDTLTGRVLGPDGLPAADAWVSLGKMSDRTDEQGRFQLDLAMQASADTLVAVKPGFLPARLVREPEASWPDDVTLVFEREPLSIDGRVLDADGNAVAGAWVGIEDATPFGWVPLEGLGMDVATQGFVEEMLRGGDRSLTRTEADPGGRFSLDGLLERTYRLQVVDPRTLAEHRTEPIRAGMQGVEIRLPAVSDAVHVAGRVVSSKGEPLAGVQVQPFRQSVSPEGTPRSPYYAKMILTGADGVFDFEGLSPEGLTLQFFGGPTISVFTHPLGEDEDLENLEIVAYQRCHFRVDLGDRPELADEFRMLDGEGGIVQLSVTIGDMAMYTELGRLEMGRSEVMAAPETARELVLYEGGEEVLRVPVSLTPGEVERIDL